VDASVDFTPKAKTALCMPSSPESNFSLDQENNFFGHCEEVTLFSAPKRFLLDSEDKENDYIRKRTKIQLKQENAGCVSESDPEDDPLTAPATVERLKRALKERIRTARTPLKPIRSRAIVWSSPVIQYNSSLENDRATNDDEVDDLLL
jgi:hypothetical protein